MTPFFATFFGLLGAVGFYTHFYGPELEVSEAGVQAEVTELLKGKKVQSRSDGREIKTQLIRQRTTASALVLGSSRAMYVTADAMKRPWNEVVNASVSGAYLEDLAALWSIWKSTGRPLDTAVVVMENWMFAENLSYNGSLRRYYERFVSGGDEGAYERFALYWQARSHWTNLKDTLSLPAFSIAWTQPRKATREPAGEDYSGAYILPDGSQIFPDFLTSKTANQVDSTAADEWGPYSGRIPWGFFSPSRREIAVKMLKDMKAYGVKRILVIDAPYHPLAFAPARDMLTEFSRFVGKIAREGGASFYAGGDPSASGCESHEFFDGHHPRESCMKKVLGLAGI